MKRLILLSCLAAYAAPLVADQVIFAGSEDLREFDKIIEKNRLNPIGGKRGRHEGKGAQQGPAAVGSEEQGKRSRGEDHPSDHDRRRDEDRPRDDGRSRGDRGRPSLKDFERGRDRGPMGVPGMGQPEAMNPDVRADRSNRRDRSDRRPDERKGSNRRGEGTGGR